MLNMLILALNPGSTSTRVALFACRAAEEAAPGAAAACEPVLSEEIQHPKADLARFATIAEQKDFRLAAIRAALAACPQAQGRLAAVVGRGGLLRPIPGGVYAINQAMLDDLAAERYGTHPCNLGAPLALELSAEHGCPAFIVDPPVTDELDEAARLTGLPEIRRRSVFHALSQRGAARAAARSLGLGYERAGFIVAHLGGGISVGAHVRGRVVEVLNALDGEGPFSPERSGRLPVLPVLGMLERGETDVAALTRRILTQGGFFAHLGSNDLREIEARIDAGDEKAALVYEAFVRAVARDIASLAPLFASQIAPQAVPKIARPSGGKAPRRGLDLNAIVVTGGMARSARLVADLSARLAFLAPLIPVTGLEEMHALADGARLALMTPSIVQNYSPKD